MANVTRVARSSDQWTERELIAYNIVVKVCKEKEFFGSEPSKLPSGLNKEFLEYKFNYKEYPPVEPDDLLLYLEMASRVIRGQESMANDFTRDLLRAIGFSKPKRLIRTKHMISLMTWEGNKDAQTDVCVVGMRNEILLVVQEHKCWHITENPEPQVIAEAIAAFHENNRIRKDYGIKHLDKMVIPCIVTFGTLPTFYLVPVTIELADHVMIGQYPENTTKVSCFFPPVPRRVESMENVEYRKKILQYYESFKKFVDELEEELKFER